MRDIFTVHATQIVTSPSNPHGIVSNVQGYPIPFDSRSYKVTEQNPNGDEEIALLASQAEYFNEIVRLATAESANRVGWAVYIIRASDGKQIALKHSGAFPDMTPTQNNPETQNTANETTSGT